MSRELSDFKEKGFTRLHGVLSEVELADLDKHVAQIDITKAGTPDGMAWQTAI